MDHLVGVAEVAHMLGLSRQRVNVIATKDPLFPRPAAELAAGRIWLRDEVEAWAVASGRQVREPRNRADGQ